MLITEFNKARSNESWYNTWIDHQEMDRWKPTTGTVLKFPNHTLAGQKQLLKIKNIPFQVTHSKTLFFQNDKGKLHWIDMDLINIAKGTKDLYQRDHILIHGTAGDVQFGHAQEWRRMKVICFETTDFSNPILHG